MEEVNILAGFRSVDDANQAAEALQKAGFSTVQVEVISMYPGNGVVRITNPISGEIPSLGHLTLGGDFPSGRDASVLAAADPSASGMSAAGQNQTDPSVLLTAVVPELRSDEAVSIIRAHGGEA